MKDLIDNGIKVDMILTDPPYGTTACKWDTIIPFNSMWDCIDNLIQDHGVTCLFGTEPFSSYLRCSNIKEYKYDWKWNKNKASNFINCKYQPLKTYEDICVFSKMASTYSKNGNMKYNPQDIKILDKPKKQQRISKRNGEIYHTSPNVETEQKVSNYPNSILNFKFVSKPIHPTQKPVDLLEYLIRTYTDKDNLVLDFTMGSGSTGVACMNTGRRFIGIEKEDKYCKIAQERIESELKY